MAFDKTPETQVAQAAAIVAQRIKPIAYSEAQSFEAWTASTAEDRAMALWAAIEPLMSAYLVNGGTASSLRPDGKAQSPLCAHIHQTAKGKRNRAARAVFAECLRVAKPRACEFSQEDHDSTMGGLRDVFLSHFQPSGKTSAKVRTKFTLEEFVSLIASGTLSDDEMSAIVGAIPPSALTAKPAKVAA